MNVEPQVITVYPEHIALLAAAVARVSKNEDRTYNWQKDKAYADFEKQLDADINIFDRNEIRYIVFLFNYGIIEVPVGPQPPKGNAPATTDDDPPGGTPGAAFATQLAMAA